MVHVPIVPYPSEDASSKIGNIVLFDNGEQYIIKAIKKKTEVGKMVEELEKVLKGCRCCLTASNVSTYICKTCPYNDVSHDYCWEVLRDDLDRMIDKIKEAKG